jgi:hypothetical protein
MKKSSKAGVEKLQAAVENLNKKATTEKDARYWSPTRDKAGNASATIRFLPAPPADVDAKGEDALPFVRIFDHGFQGPGGWYIENSRTTLGKDEKDPVSDSNRILWNTGTEENQKIVRARKRRLKYIANVLVVKDPANPENDGKVFLFKFGKKVFDKITEAMNPLDEDEKAIEPFDFWKGANFKLRVRVVDKFPNYDKSQFEAPSAVSDNDKDLEKIWQSQYSLLDEIDPRHFKPYGELKARLDRVLGGETVSDEDPTDTVVDSAPKAAVSLPPKASTPKASPKAPVDDGDDDEAFFANLAKD